ncbi:tetraspanin-7-like [Diospyros lotus]|uniref:tetraspanin-7-like n=1 Tax=Diospyros lotus TaxID=55363 RepID=UPI00225A96F2|nr:tetraspanin-7-like [Diospyros lotus]
MEWGKCCLVCITCLSLCITYLAFAASIIASFIELFKSQENCEQFLQLWPKILWLPFVLMVISTLIRFKFNKCGNKATTCCAQWFEIALAVFLLIYFFKSLSATIDGGGVALPGKAYKEFHLVDYSTGLQAKVNDTRMWRHVAKCLRQRRVCNRLSRTWVNVSLAEFHSKPLSSIESGCCKPPSDCNFSYVKPTEWRKIANSSRYSSSNSDCEEWSNDPKALCFNCDSCKAGVADKFKHNWFEGMLTGMLCKWTFLPFLHWIRAC